MNGVAEKYDHLAPHYDARWARYLLDSHTLLRAHLFANPGDTLVDVGCGTGLLLSRILGQEPGIRAIGIDLSSAMLAAARARLDASVLLMQGEATAVPLASQSSDWLISSSVLHYLPDPDVACDEWHRVLKPGGQLVVVDWCADFFTTRLLSVWSALRERRRVASIGAATLRSRLRAHGFENVVVRRRRCGVWGLMAATAQRAERREM